MVDRREPPFSDRSMVWREGAWQEFSRDWIREVAPETSIAISLDEYPDLAELVRFADDVDLYLLAIGISEDSVFGIDAGPTIGTDDGAGQSNRFQIPNDDGSSTGLDA